MAAFEWGLSKWDIDKPAESLNKDLFGDKKMQKKALVPDSKDDNKGSYSIQDSDDEQLSKKAKKRLKERMRKKKKKVGNAGDGSSLKENMSIVDSKNKQIPSNEKSSVSGERNEKKKKRNKKKGNDVVKSSHGDGSSQMDKKQNEKGVTNESTKKKKSIKSDKKESPIPLNPNTNEKPKKRKKSESELPNNDLNVKKRKIIEDVGENNGELQKKKRKRPNRKKKNNSKKNKYKHLALNSTSDKGDAIPNGETKKMSTETENMVIAKNSVAQAGKSNDISNSPSHPENDSQLEKNILSQKKDKAKRQKSRKVNEVVNLQGKEVSQKKNQSNVVTPSSDNGNGMEHEVGSSNRQKNDKSKSLHKIDKQKLLNLLKKSTPDPVDQSQSSLNNEISLKESKKRAKKRKRSKSGNNDNEESVTNKHFSSLAVTDSLIMGSVDSPLSKSPSKGQSNPAKELKDKATEKLKAARFRFINEQLYNCKGNEALQLFRKDMEAFKVYHQGFQSQTTKWPVNPLDAIIKHLNKRPKQLEVADFGCGDARLSESVPQKVHSFDLVALNDRVTACDMSKTPLSDDSIDIAVFCLSLMGTNLNDYVLEANRVLKTGGLLKIAEVVSRFHNPDQFVKHVSSLGFLLLNRRELSDMFYLMDFKKVKRIKKSPSNVEIKLKPCVYKKR